MSKSQHFWAGAAGALTLASIIQLLPTGGGLVAMVVVLLLSVAAVVAGRHFPLGWKVFATGVVYFYGFSMCLLGRTMEPGLTAYTSRMALICFGVFALVPGLSLLRLWNRQRAVWLLALLTPASFGLSALTAMAEEKWFVHQHREAGAGPTPRWTVSHHWLSYDAKTGVLDGSD